MAIFGGIPLPKTIADTGPGGNLFTNMNAVNQAGLANAKQAIENQYAPSQQFANAALTSQQAKYLPLQYQMQNLPMMMALAKDNPAMQEQVNKILNNPIAGASMADLAKEFGIPMPNQDGGNVFANLAHGIGNIFGMGGGSPSPAQGGGVPQQQQTTAPYDNEISGGQGSSVTNPTNAPVAAPVTEPTKPVGTPIVPATQGSGAGVAGTMTAQYTRANQPAGSLIPDPANPGHVLVTPTSETIARGQKASIEAETLRPIVKEVVEGSKKWFEPGIKGKLHLAAIANTAKQNFGDVGGLATKLMKKLDISEKDLSDYANWQADQGKLVNRIMEAGNWPANIVSENKIADIVTPHPGEGKNFGPRIQHDLEQIDNQVRIYQEAVRNGTTTAPLSIQYPGSINKVPGGTGAGEGIPVETKEQNPKEFNVDKFLNQKFSSAEDFNSALDSYNPEIKRQIIDILKRRSK